MLISLMKLKKHPNSLLLFVLCLLCVVVLSFLQKPLLNEQENMTSQDYLEQEKVKKIQLNLFSKLPYLGFDNLISDWLYLDFVQYYGDFFARKTTGYQLLPDYYKLIVNSDPRFIDAYLYLDTGTTLFAGRPDVSVDLMNQGLSYLTPDVPLAYQLWIYKGINELLFLGETQQAIKSYRKGAQWAKIFNTPRSLSQAMRAEETASFLAKNPDSRLARASAWLIIVSNARDDQVRKYALAKLRETGAEVTITPNSISVRMPDD